MALRQQQNTSDRPGLNPPSTPILYHKNRLRIQTVFGQFLGQAAASAVSGMVFTPGDSPAS